MEHTVTHLAAVYGVDLAQPGASLAIDLPEQAHRWLIANIDGERIGVTRCQVDAAGLLCPDLDMVFALTPDGWEPQELAHSDQVWQAYAQAMQATGHAIADPRDDFNFATFTDYMALDLMQQWTTQ